MRILFILVVYFNEDEAESFFKSQLKEQSNQDYHVLIVNNGSNSHEKFSSKFNNFSNIEIIGTGQNLGYLGGASLAIKYFREKFPTSDPLVILSNTDIEFVEKDFLEKLLSVERNYDVAGPSIVSTITNSQLNPFSEKRYSKLKLKFLHRIYSIYFLYVVYQTLSLLKRKFFSEKPAKSLLKDILLVYAIHGSFMIFGPGYFKKGGNFNFGSFLYEEELFIAEQAKHFNMRTIYIPDLHLLHREHATTGIYKSRKHISYMCDSILYILKTFYHE